MREIKFRAISLFNFEFVKGNYLKTVFKDKTDSHKIYPYLYNVPPEDIDINTLGQFTGLKDKNGTEIYEGDILNAAESLIEIRFYGCYFQGVYLNESEENSIPIRNNNYLHWQVVGNIHEK